MTPEFMKELLDWLKGEKKLHRKYAFKVGTQSCISLCVCIILLKFYERCFNIYFSTQIILTALEIMKSQPTLVDVSIPEVRVC